jgi:hypothetical protein
MIYPEDQRIAQPSTYILFAKEIDNQHNLAKTA